MQKSHRSQKASSQRLSSSITPRKQTRQLSTQIRKGPKATRTNQLATTISPQTASFSATATETTSTEPQTQAPKRKKSKRNTKSQSTETLTQSTDVKNHTAISNSPHGVLVRDFMRESLYSKTGYFNASRVINSPGVINFSQLLGKAAYEKRLDELYFSGIQGWTTPVEIFQPFYAQSLARYFVSHLINSVNMNSLVDSAKLGELLTYQKQDKKIIPKDIDHFHSSDGLTLKQDNFARSFGVGIKRPDSKSLTDGVNVSIIEIGGGNGTCASNIMDFLRMYYPNIYKATNYTIFEMSETLSWQQRELLDAAHSGKYRVHTKNAAEIDFSTLTPSLKRFHGIPASKNNETQDSTTPPQTNQDPALTSATNPDGTITQLPPQRRPPQQYQSQQPVSKAAKADFGQSTKTSSTKTHFPKDHAFIFGLEVLDNMVHDKVIKGTDGNWYQVMVSEKSSVEAVERAAKEGGKRFKFPLYEHPKDALQSTLQELKQSVNEPNTISAPPEAPQGSDSTTLMADTKSKSKKALNYHEIDAQTLNRYMTEQPFPVQYHLLNTLPGSKYFEYVMPIYDPIIEECANLFSTYTSSPYFDSQSPSISHSQNKDLPQHQQGGLLKWLTSRILKKNLSFVDEVVYLPTELLRFIHRINILYPSHTLLLADFDALPTTEEIPAVNAPVVAHKATESQLRGKTKDEPSYLVELGLCDIFFPTDFNFVKHMYSQVCLDGQIPKKQHISPLSTLATTTHAITDDSIVLDSDSVKTILSSPTPIENATIALTQELFLNSFSETRKTECKNGFNPMLSDYNNMALFIGQRE